jgi:two-component system sensor histidine kinase UhpB
MAVSRDDDSYHRNSRMISDPEKHLRETQKLAHVGSWECDVACAVIQWSDEHFEIFGVNRADFKPTLPGILAYVHPRDAQRVADLFSHALEHHLPFACEYRVTKPDGHECVISARGAWDSERPGAASRMYGTAQDITERRQTEDALQLANKRVRALATRVVQAQESERMRIARELHDEIGQALAAVQIGLHGLKRLSTSDELLAEVAKCTAVAERALDQVRSLSINLRPPHLDDLGLEAALRWFVREHCNEAGPSCSFESEGFPADLSPDVSIACFRVAQEALTNVVRHAAATEVVVTLRCSEDELALCIEDNGRGFDVQSMQALSGSIGLLGMQERATLAGGRLEIASGAQGGTRVSAYVPLSFGTPGSDA